MKQGYTIIRILQEDIYLDKNNWEENTKNTIKTYNKPQVICIGCDKKYEKHNNITNGIEITKTIYYRRVNGGYVKV